MHLHLFLLLLALRLLLPLLLLSCKEAALKPHLLEQPLSLLQRLPLLQR